MEKVKLKDIAEFIKTGKTPPTSQSQYFDGSINWYTPGDFNNGKNLKTSKRTLTQKALDEKKAITFPKDTLLITCIGDIGKIGISQEDCSSNQQITAIKPKDEIDVNYLYYWFLNNKNVLANTANNAVVPILNNKTLQEIDFNYPPFATQQRIAAILDQADAIIQNNRAIVQKYDALTQSLFLDMFGDPVKNEKGWEIRKMEEISLKITDGTHQSPKFLKEGIPFLLVSNIVNNKINYKTNKFISEEDFETLNKRTPIEIGNILLTSVGSYGNPAIIESQMKFAFQRHIAFIKPNHSMINYHFLFHFLKSDLIKREIDKKVKGAAQKTYNLVELKKLRIILPTITLQNQFAERVAVIEAQKQQAQLELAKSEELFQSLLQRAFKGELS
jgi:type I restriction enzyme S subunit